MRGIGKGVREFNDAKESMKKEINDSKNEQAKRTSSEREVVKETDRNN